MLLGQKYQIIPSDNQKKTINQSIGGARFIYNNLLADYKSQIGGETPPKVKLYSSLKPQNPWMKDCDSLALSGARVNLEKALTNFFKSKKGARKGKKVGFPTFKSKHTSKLTYTTNNQGGNIRVENNMIKLPKVGWVKINLHRPLRGEIRSCHITLKRNGKYEISLLCEVAVQQHRKEIQDINSLKVVGLDLSYSEFAVDSEEVSDDTKTKYVRHYRINEKKTKRLSRRVSKKQLKGKNSCKAKRRLAAHHEYVKNCRLDFCHKLSKYYVTNYDVIVLEDLDLSQLAKNKLRGHSKSVLDLGFGQFRQFLDYKSIIYDSVVLQANRWFPSSQTCCVCLNKNKFVKDLSVREWDCPFCGEHHNRDKNAAKNLKQLFYKELNTCGAQEIHAWGDGTSTLRETVRQVLSLNQESPPFMGV